MIESKPMGHVHRANCIGIAALEYCLLLQGPSGCKYSFSDLCGDLILNDRFVQESLTNCDMYPDNSPLSVDIKDVVMFVLRGRPT